MKVKIGNSEKAEREKNEASNQDGMRMSLKVNSSSLAEEEAESIAPNRDRLQRKLKGVKSSGEGKKSNQNVVQKKLKLDSPNLEGTSRRAKVVARMKISKQDGVGRNVTPKNPITDKKLDNEAHKQDGMQKNLKRSSKTVEKESPKQNGVPNEHKKKCSRGGQEAKNKSSMQGVLHKKLKPKRIGAEEGRGETPEQDDLLNNPSFVSTPYNPLPPFSENLLLFLIH